MILHGEGLQTSIMTERDMARCLIKYYFTQRQKIITGMPSTSHTQRRILKDILETRMNVAGIIP